MFQRVLRVPSGRAWEWRLYLSGLSSPAPVLPLPSARRRPSDAGLNGADSPQEQLAALDKFAQEHADSKFMPCVNEYYASVNLKLKDYDKSIEYAEKDLAANYQDLNLYIHPHARLCFQHQGERHDLRGHQQSSRTRPRRRPALPRGLPRPPTKSGQRSRRTAQELEQG
jgi:hypothetical protein